MVDAVWAAVNYLLWFGLDGRWWISLDLDLVSEQLVDGSYKKGWLVLFRCGGG